MFSQSQIKEFQDKGYLIFRKVLDDNTISKCLIAYDKMRSKVKNIRIYIIENFPT